METNPRVVVTCKRLHGFQQFQIQLLRQAGERDLAHLWITMPQRLQKEILAKRSREAGQAQQRHHRVGPQSAFKRGFERVRKRLGLLLHQLAECDLPLPCIDAAKSRHPLLGGLFFCDRGRCRCAFFSDHAPNAPQFAAALKVGVFAHFFRKIIRMLDDLPRHITHIERAVRTACEKHRPEPVVPGREEFASV